ncbi:MAG TPA: hypothetical protein VHX86_06490 [Tepidisphaeraceae bacterium]|jgi:glycosyltransferase involved in cell wall biosynthesis|nr:hypothetical protein [Tepidisphaeraceae bacterium]
MATASFKPSLWVIGSENPRIRDFFNQVGRWMNVTYLDVERIGYTLSFDQLVDSWRWRRPNGGFPEARICVPQRYRAFSAALAHWFCRRRFAQVGRPDAVVFTWPHLAPLCELLPDVFRIYYCKDPFDRWPGDAAQVRAQEDRLLHHCDAAFAVSRQLVEDMIPRARAKVFYCPNAVDDSFIQSPRQPRPRDLPLGRPVIGCVGRMNYSYDWDYIRHLTTAIPDALFCFVGPMIGVNDFDHGRILFQFRSTPNILWLGARSHRQLLSYIQHFDVCFNSLRADEFNHRRSPLRLYDYLATDRPILSTAVREAYEQLPHIFIAPGPHDAVDMIRQILQGRLGVDLAARSEYIRQNTWSVRAAQFIEHLQECGFNPGFGSQAA